MATVVSVFSPDDAGFEEMVQLIHSFNADYEVKRITWPEARESVKEIEDADRKEELEKLESDD